ncbi:TPA: hypothetical protein ACH3X3_014819 [Trebouxia sp. C0006]
MGITVEPCVGESLQGAVANGVIHASTGLFEASHSDDAVPLVHDDFQGSTQLPSAAPGAALFPGELTSSLTLSKGSVRLVHVPTQVQALQAKVISRMLKPERLAWKVLQL